MAVHTIAYRRSAIKMKIDCYVHTDKLQMLELGEKHGITGEALEYFKFAGCEVKLTMDVNTLTGEAKIVAVDGKELQL